MMEQFIQQYLFTRLYCPLPGIGTLVLNETSAFYDVTLNEIKCPRKQLSIESNVRSIDGLAAFIATQLQTTAAEAKQQLQAWVRSFMEDESLSHFTLAGIGKFKKSNDGKIDFSAISVHELSYPVVAKRVIRNDAVHAVLVGDRERSSDYMSELLQEGKKPVKRFYWWIWAVVLMMVCLSVLAYYGVQSNFSEGFGNQQKIKISPANSTYQTIP